MMMNHECYTHSAELMTLAEGTRDRTSKTACGTSYEREREIVRIGPLALGGVLFGWIGFDQGSEFGSSRSAPVRLGPTLCNRGAK